MLDTQLACPVNDANVEPAPTVTELGTVSAELLDVNPTAAPADGAAAERATLHLVVDPEDTVVGEQVRLDTLGAVPAATDKVKVLAPPFSVAVIVTDPLLATAPLVALKVAEVAPAATVTDAGTVTIALLLARVAAAPPAGAALVRVRVQVLVALDPRLEGAQASDEINTGATRLIVAVPLLPL